MQLSPTRERAACWLAQRALYLDTETTGLDDKAEIVEISILDSTGRPLLDTLLKPSRLIPQSATDVHGITNRDVIDAPRFADIYDRVFFFVTVRPTVIYNAVYDLRMIQQTASQQGLRPARLHADCAMLLYAEHYGEWDDRRNAYRWQSLTAAAQHCRLDIPMNIHRASADAELTRQLVLYMAGEQHS